MDGVNFLRRRLVIRAMACAAVLTISACDKSDKSAACADSEKMSPSEKSLREVQHYVEQSPDPAKVCGGCAFFSAAEGAVNCGRCQIFNGPANAKGHCTSWAART
jgi:hypothetical protein